MIYIILVRYKLVMKNPSLINDMAKNSVSYRTRHCKVEDTDIQEEARQSSIFYMNIMTVFYY